MVISKIFHGRGRFLTHKNKSHLVFRQSHSYICALEKPGVVSDKKPGEYFLT